MLFRKPDQVREPLYAVVPLQNPWRWRSRWKHTERAIKHFMDSGAVVYLVEMAFNRREFAFENSGLHNTLASCEVLGENHNFRHQWIGLRAPTELWLKENLINVAASRLPYDWQQICWLDSDVHFVRPNWVGECIHRLQHYSFLQMFKQAQDLTPDYNMLPADYPHAAGVSFLQSWKEGTLIDDLSFRFTKAQEGDYYYGRRVFPGLAWACTRKAWDDVGGLIDVAIWGGADWHMAHALVDKTDSMMHTKLHPNYKETINSWHEKAQRHIRKNIGVMEGAIFHHWHGKKTSRGYGDKHRILAQNQFDPVRHLKRDYQGLWQLHDDGSEAYITLRDSFRKIVRDRNEDSIDI